MQKNSPQNNFLAKDYYVLDEVAKRFGVAELDLVHLGVTKDLPICVLARDWQVELHSRRLNFPAGPILSTLNPALAAERETAFQDDSKLFGYAVQPNKREYSARHPGLKTLNGPIRVAVSTLQIYEIEGSSASTVVELIAEGQPLPGYEYEYRFNLAHSTGKAKLNEVKFVLRERDVLALESLLSDVVGNKGLEESSC